MDILEENLRGAHLLPYGHPALEECYELRHAYFVGERQWVSSAPTRPGIETDRYDAHAIHLACFDEQGVAAYLRALPYDPPVGFMFDFELSGVLPEEERASLPRNRSLELSRLAVRSNVPFRSPRDPHPIEEILRLLYRLSLEQDYERYYIVVEQAWLAPFTRRFGLPFNVLGQPTTFPDGTVTALAAATREELEAGMRRHSSERYRWYSSENEEAGTAS